MESLKYPIEYVASVLDVSSSTVAELKKKLKIGKYIQYEDIQRLKKVVRDIKRHTGGGRVSLTSINQFMRYYDISKY